MSRPHVYLHPLQSIQINRSFDKSTAMVGDGVPEAGSRELQGLELTVWSTSNDYSMVGYLVDQIESLIDEWFPGMCVSPSLPAGCIFLS